ncbi:DNA recombination protein RmuC [Chitinivorax tropicus]|uniref:DNA recombination protein RmuC n=1 Tax=Chitinivorax tropicus TaxID=714531 RepID=A0A840MK67_9PROT|nr:DNA recombination protein RmuC [Chitinivorax tropicus]MBB5017895.1 DNA recombination protein RmuC [Chitinivorax tropicus]
MLETLFGLATIFILLAAAVVVWKLGQLTASQESLSLSITQSLEEKHRVMVGDIHHVLGDFGDRLARTDAENAERLRTAMTEAFERLRSVVVAELQLARQQMQTVQHTQAEQLATNREYLIKQLADFSQNLSGRQDALKEELLRRVFETLSEQGKQQQDTLQNTMRVTTEQLTRVIEQLTTTVDTRLEQISGKVTERLDEGFKKTNETFANVMARLAVIDEAQRKIDGLTTNVVSLQELLGDKRSRGAFGEVQLEALVSNILPAQFYKFQETLSNKTRADCVLHLPEPTGTVAIDSKFPLENYHRIFSSEQASSERLNAEKQFKQDVKRHIDAISDKYIVPGETSDGALMFIPAEAVFAEIHAYHPELVQHALQKRVWIVSPTTMMAVLNTARAVIKDVETRRQVHIIKDALSKLGVEFKRFDQRMTKLADHIRMAHQDAEAVQITSQKISRRFEEIEHVRLESNGEAAPLLEESVSNLK